MPVIDCSVTTSLPPERVLDALTDFGPDRPKRWPNLDPKYFQTHALEPTSAEVTEGSSFAGGVWERARYDWSERGVVKIAVVDSNAFKAGASWTYRVQPEGPGSRVELRVDRRGRTLKGRLLASVLRVSGRAVFCGDLQKTLAALEHG
jgi:hypothetical protein